jgi:hypothetical protein
MRALGRSEAVGDVCHDCCSQDCHAAEKPSTMCAIDEQRAIPSTRWTA